MIFLKEDIDTQELKIVPNTDAEPIQEIVNTFTDEEKEFLVVDGGDYTDGYNNKNVIKSFVLYIDDVPVSFVDFWQSSYDPSISAVAIGTRNSVEYRCRGYASMILDYALNWADEYLEKDSIDFLVNRKNKDFIRIAKELGFEFIGESTTDKDWLFYNLCLDN